MGDTRLRGAALAAAAAVAFSTSASAELPNMWSETPALIKCEGANSCRGQSMCNTMANSCQGQNACKGQGWIQIVAPTPKEAIQKCKEKGGKFAF